MNWPFVVHYMYAKCYISLVIPNRLICEISLYFTWKQKANNTISNIIIDTGINNDNKFVQILRKNFHICITLHAHAPHPKNIGMKQSGNEVSDSRKYCWKYYS